jgi:hypothetical protein
LWLTPRQQFGKTLQLLHLTPSLPITPTLQAEPVKKDVYLALNGH